MNRIGRATGCKVVMFEPSSLVLECLPSLETVEQLDFRWPVLLSPAHAMARPKSQPHIKWTCN